jgi:hypothetical protein
MVGTVRPVSVALNTGRDREQSDRGSKSHHENTPGLFLQDLNKPPLRREQFPKLTDEQWRERRAVLRRHARQQNPGFPVTFGGSVVDFYKSPRFRWKRKS